MRVLAISDVIVPVLYSPAIRDIAHDIDFVVSCGDLPSAYLEYIVSMMDKPLYYVMGNHGARGGEHPEPEGCVNLDEKVVNHKGLILAGLEGSMRYNDAPRYQYTDTAMRLKMFTLERRLWLNRLRYGRFLDVFVTHSPPFRIHDGEDLTHTGFKSFVSFIDRYHPRYMLHGHTHLYDNRAVRESIRGQTQIINTYGYKFLDLPLPTEHKHRTEESEPETSNVGSK